MHYVLGFQFNAACDKVALVRKVRPESQVGLWNGIGGAVERGESARQAMHREFNEETGAEQPGVRWQEYARLVTWTGNTVSCFSSFTDQVFLVKTATDEEVGVHEVGALLGRPKKYAVYVSNLPWLVAMALSVGDVPGGFKGDASQLLTIVEQAPW